jgi:DNA gyrase/topoisomerase IV subunit A
MNIIPRKLTNIIDTEFREFSMYTIENRAIPSAVDGFKPTQRKLVYAMITEYRGNKIKVAELGGGLAKLNYHHGEGSAQGAAVGLASDWNNNAPVFTGHGNFGSRLVPEAAAPRYIFASLSENFKKYFLDTEVAPKSNDPENPEPAHYLPIIPWVLVNGISGIAVGFKTEILPRSIKDLTSATLECIKNPEKFLKADKPIAPTFPSFKGKVVQTGPNQWKTVGVAMAVGKLAFKISELPIGYDRESYVEFLNTLIDKDLIKDYNDVCSKDGFGFEVKVSIQQKVVIDKDPIKYFKLERSHTEILTTLGYDGKLKIFESVAQLIHYFVEYRTGKFGDKIAYDIAENEASVNELELKVKFIKLVINRKVDFRTSTKQQLLDFVADNVSKEDFAKKFINIPLYECTQDEVNKLEEKIAEKKTVLAQLRKTTPVELYKTRLAAL